MPRTIVRPSRDLRNNYADVVKSLKRSNHVIITNNGVGESVLISIEDYTDYEEYLHRRFIHDELQKRKIALNDPDVILHDAADVFVGIKKKIEARSL